MELHLFCSYRSTNMFQAGVYVRLQVLAAQHAVEAPMKLEGCATGLLSGLYIESELDAYRGASDLGTSETAMSLIFRVNVDNPPCQITCFCSWPLGYSTCEDE